MAPHFSEDSATPPSGATAPAQSALPTYFAPAERMGPEQVRKEIETASHNPVVDALLFTVSGLLAVLNEQRQILAVNERLHQSLGLEKPADILGLRLGEVVQCIHANDGPGGCATGEYCRNCGAAVAQVLSLQEDQPMERVCAIDTSRGGTRGHLYFHIRACPVQIGGQRLLLLFLKDVSQQQRSATLERAFFHDLNNTLTGLLGASEELVETVTGADAELARNVHRLVERLNREIQLQQCVSAARWQDIVPQKTTVSVRAVIADRTVTMRSIAGIEEPTISRPERGFSAWPSSRRRRDGPWCRTVLNRTGTVSVFLGVNPTMGPRLCTAVDLRS